MRAVSTTTITLAALLAVSTVSGTAGAAGGDSKDPGKGASGPASAGSGPSGGGGEVGVEGTPDRADRSVTGEAPKVWEVGASYEYHRLVTAQSVVPGTRAFMYVGFYARWDVTKYDRLALRGGAYTPNIIDQGDSPMRFDDLSLAYTRLFPLVGHTNMRLTLSVAAPTSYASQLATLIVAPRLALQADHKFGKYFTVDARVSGTGYIVRCSTEGSYNCDTPLADMLGGTLPNAKANVGGTLSLDFAMPFHDALSIGASGYVGYIWFYNVDGALPNMSGYLNGVQMPVNAGFAQPVSQAWGGEVYVRYAFPSLFGLKTDLSFAVANGDPTKGYGSVLHDGVQHVPLGYIETLEAYGVVSAHY